jgi:Domain of unknown function (DUF4276)
MADLRLGVLAEHKNDCAVIEVLVRRILKERGVEHGAWRLEKRSGQGCATLERKAGRWFAELADSGCAAAILLHDLDRDPCNGTLNDEGSLAKRLEQIPAPPGLRKLICIPVEEIEAWFFSSVAVLRKIGGLRQKAHTSPHRVRQPKETLLRMSRALHTKARYSENDNHKYAEDLDLKECSRLCPAFSRLRAFVEGLAQETSNPQRRGRR